MTHHQVLVFGSFTEDEIRSMQFQPQKNDIEITFGSFDSETLRSVGIFNTRVIALHSPNTCELSNPSKPPNVIRLSSSTGSTSFSEAAFLKDNGCTSCTCPGDSVANELELPASLSSNRGHSVSNKSTLGLPDVDRVSELSSSLEAVALDDSRNDESTLEESCWRNPIPRNFLPRGLVNLGNLCFLNATLQALLSCSPFFELLHDIKDSDIPQIGYPTLRAFVDFISDFDMVSDSNDKRNEKTVPDTGKPFRPVMFESILKSFTPDIPDNLSGRPRQEDAQEFLSFVMHQMHDELLKLDGHVSNGNGKPGSLVSSNDESEDDNWETVGPRNKTAITRTQSFVPSKLSTIFGGRLKSVVKAKGNKASATIQPFLLLHLNICPEPVCTVEDALRLFSAPETLEGYRTSAAGKIHTKFDLNISGRDLKEFSSKRYTANNTSEILTVRSLSKAEVVTASKSVKILELSEIMILHLMRFSYESQGSTKLHKTVHFPLELVVGRELLASPSTEGRRYELVATITHHGRDPSKGHYTADARHPTGTWLRYDDASVTPIPESKVLHDQAYVLFYRQL